MSVLEALFRICARAWSFVSRVLLDNDFSFIEKEYFKISVIDILGFLLCIWILKQLLEWMFQILSSLLRSFSQAGFTGIYQVVLRGVSHVFRRSYATSVYLWHIPRVQQTKNSVLRSWWHHSTRLLSIVKNAKPW